MWNSIIGWFFKRSQMWSFGRSLPVEKFEFINLFSDLFLDAIRECHDRHLARQLVTRATRTWNPMTWLQWAAPICAVVEHLWRHLFSSWPSFIGSRISWTERAAIRLLAYTAIAHRHWRSIRAASGAYVAEKTGAGASAHSHSSHVFQRPSSSIAWTCLRTSKYKQKRFPYTYLDYIKSQLRSSAGQSITLFDDWTTQRKHWHDVTLGSRWKSSETFFPPLKLFPSELMESTNLNGHEFIIMWIPVNRYFRGKYFFGISLKVLPESAVRSS